MGVAGVLGLFAFDTAGPGGRGSGGPDAQASPRPARVDPPAPASVTQDRGPATAPASVDVVTSPMPPPMDLQAGPWAGKGLRLTGVVIAPGLRLALLRPRAGGASLHVRLEDSPAALAGWRLADVQPDSVRFEGPDGSRTLRLQATETHGAMATATPVVRSVDMEPRVAPETAPVADSADAQLLRLRRRIAASSEDVRHLLTAEEWIRASDPDRVSTRLAH